MSPERLNEVKKQVQAILDHHLPEEKRFSVAELDEEQVFFLIDLLLEKDDKKRENMFKDIKKRIKLAKKDLRITYTKILEIKDKVDYTKHNSQTLQDLWNSIESDNEFDSKLQDL
ncbi:MAG: hypothetical protein K6E76_04375 [Patescibacteria group bacterium]|nr:hypothetical protein [Patescibacteria group bacterium]